MRSKVLFLSKLPQNPHQRRLFQYSIVILHRYRLINRNPSLHTTLALTFPYRLVIKNTIITMNVLRNLQSFLVDVVPTVFASVQLGDLLVAFVSEFEDFTFLLGK